MSIYELSERVGRNLRRVPVLGTLLQKDYERAFHRGRGRYAGVYASFAEAERSIPQTQKVGFNHIELAGLYRNRLKANPSDYPVLYWLRRILGPGEVIYDFGGHVGISYHGWRNYLDYPADLRWIVYDLPEIARAGEELARDLPHAGLSFTSSLSDARDCTLFMAAGSLQFVDRSLPSLLEEAGCRPRHLIVTKLPLYDGEPFVTVQSAGNAFHPYQIGNRSAFVSGITALGYRVVDSWENAEQFCRIPFAPERDIDAYCGFYFTLDPK